MSLPRPTTPESLLAGVSLLVDELDRGGGLWQEIGATGAPAFQNTWSNNVVGYETAAYYRDPLGMVRLKGLVNSPAGAGTGNGTVCFTLPDGYRPPLPVRRTANGFSAATGLGFIDIATTGTVTLSLVGVAANAVVTNFTLACDFRIS